MHTIEIEGARYIKASEAAKQGGYTADYVGQLARAGKIDARQVGRAWYVREHEISKHKSENARSNKEKTVADIRKSIAAQPHEINNIYYVPPPAQVSEFRKRLMDTAVKYEHDSQPLAPQVARKIDESHSVGLHATIPVEESGDTPVEIPSEAPVSVVVQDEASAVSLTPERPEEPQMHGGVHVSLVEEDDTQSAYEKTADVSPQSLRHTYLHERDVFQPAQQESHQNSEVMLTDVPVIALGRRRSLSLMRPVVSALAPLVLFLMLAFAMSGMFLERVLVYQQGETQAAQPYYQAYYNLIQLNVLKEKISR